MGTGQRHAIPGGVIPEQLPRDNVAILIRITTFWFEALCRDMMVSSDSIQEHYAEQGYFFPLQVLSAENAYRLGRQLVSLGNSDWAKSLGYRGQLSHLHAISPAVNELIRNPVILSAVESILGPNLMVWGSSVFMKPGNSPGFVSWHQDLTYWGLNND